MRRHTFALLSLLALLALGLIALDPNRSEAGSLGELAFAIQIEETDAGDPIVCPRLCCPLGDEFDCYEEPSCDEAVMELNAAETSDAEAQLATDESDTFDYDAYYDDYGFEYGDEYDPYSDEEITSEDVESESDTVTSADMELNAPQTYDDTLHADECFDECHGEYASEYASEYSTEEYSNEEYAYESTEQGCDYTPTDDDLAADVTDEGDDASHVPVELPWHCGVRSQISDSDLVVDDTQEYVDSFDAYDHQVGDDYASEQYDADYDEEDFYYEYSDESSDNVAQESAEEEATADATSEVDDSYAQEYDEEYGEGYDEEYGEGYDEEYYDDYYDESDAEQHEEDYERYYSEEYYDQLEENSPTADPSEASDDYTSEYDAIYDEAVYGDAHAAAGYRYDVATPPMVLEEPSDIESAYLAGRCIDEGSCEIIDDLPWADELEVVATEETNADVSQVDVPVALDQESAYGEASEYGSDYAEEYYESYDEEHYESLEEELAPLEDAVSMPESTNSSEYAPESVAMNTMNGIDIIEIVTYLGREVSRLADSLNVLGSTVRTACDDMGPLTQNR